MKISVIMGIYNCEPYLDEAVQCILNQTYTDWELIMCDDGSSDQTYDIARKYEMQYPNKIKVLKNVSNQGLNYTLNRCLKAARGQYIARMDGDDLCSSDRFEKEVAILDSRSDISIVSAYLEYFDENGVWGICRYKEYPQKKDFLRGPQFCHAACMVRKEAFDQVEGYTVDKKLLRVEDYHLWVKMYAAGYRGYNIQEPLYQMRDDQNAYHRRKFKYRINEMYVKILLIKKFKLPIHSYVLALKPVMIGLLPMAAYKHFHKARLKNAEEHFQGKK